MIKGSLKEMKQKKMDIERPLITVAVTIYNIKDYLFTSTSNNNKDGKLNTITIRRIVTKLFKKANLNTEKLSTHSTRHTSVELALQSGMAIQEVSEMVRHSSISTTMIYSKEIKQRESQFANILTDAIMG